MQVTAVGPINAGAAPVHYEIGDQNGVIQLPTGITVALSADNTAAGVVVAADGTGWFFSAPNSAPATPNGTVTFTDSVPNPPVVATFPCTVVGEAVTGLTLFQQ
jgi:hypothetical protein